MDKWLIDPALINDDDLIIAAKNRGVAILTGFDWRVKQKTWEFLEFIPKPKHKIPFNPMKLLDDCGYLDEEDEIQNRHRQLVNAALAHYLEQGYELL